VSGSVGGVAYLHCDAQSEKQIDLVLLHGGSYTKEIWESNGLLDHLCSTPSMSVSALDLSTSAGHDSLQSVLDAMKTANLIDLPVALVTPSASGFTMINWMLSNDPSQVTSYIATWVPIATGSLTLASDTQVVKTLEGVRVLAIYGDRDTAGGKLSQRLGELVNATVVELVGGHPVYLHSPNEFVDKIVSFLRL
jgi:pimeloyl-ACP methyl ester carboxylesterase